MPGRGWRRSLALVCIWTLGCWLLFSSSARLELHNVLERLESLDGEDGNSPGLGGRELLRVNQENLSISTSSVSTTESSIYNLLEAEPFIDRSPKLSEADLASKLQPQMPNLPILYWQENKDKKLFLNSTCAKFPSVFDLHFNNKYWQEVQTTNGTFHLYGAYLDVRAANRLGPTVRILGMIDRLEPKVKTHCQLWFPESSEPVLSKVLEYKYIWYKKWGNYKHGLFQPYLMACQLPKSHWGKVPSSVSIVEKPCDTATSNLRVIYNKPAEGEGKKDFAVCVKGLDFPSDDLSVRLAEWIETLVALGADTVFLYSLEVHPNITKVLEHYSEEGVVDVTPISLPGHQPNLPFLQHMYLKSKLNNKRQNEVIPYNDCLYRNMYRYKYIALLDIDEVITPITKSSWAELMEEVVAASLKVKNATRASWNFRNVYFMDGMEKEPEKEVPGYLHMLQHVYRSANYTKPGQYVKCFHNPEKALILHNHFPLGCLGGVCTSYPVDIGMAHLQHYRSDCVKTLKKSCEQDFKLNSVRDTTLWRWKDQIISRTTPVLEKLGFLGSRTELPR